MKKLTKKETDRALKMMMRTVYTKTEDFILANPLPLPSKASYLAKIAMHDKEFLEAVEAEFAKESSSYTYFNREFMAKNSPKAKKIIDAEEKARQAAKDKHTAFRDGLTATAEAVIDAAIVEGWDNQELVKGINTFM